MSASERARGPAIINKETTAERVPALGACARHSRRVCVACALQTVIFPIEHTIWGRVLGPLFGLTF